MPSAKPVFRQFSTCLLCVKQTINGSVSFTGVPMRFLSTSAVASEQLQTEAGSPTQSVPISTTSEADFMRKWGDLDPNLVERKLEERRLLRREGIMPIGSRRRRATLRRSMVRNTEEVPFEQLPYQCFQEARKVLLEDRQEKLQQIEVQSERLRNLLAQEPSVSGGAAAKEARIRSMRNHLNELIVLADINDPVVKKKFDDGQGDMNKPIYRYLADKKWRQYKRLILEQRLNQLNIVPDLLPSLDTVVDIDLAFSRNEVEPGEFVDSLTSEKMPRLKVQSFEQGEKLVTVVVVDADVPEPGEDAFTYRCHLIASNISISPTQTSIPFIKIDQEDKKANDPSARHIAVPWLPPWAHRGAPYHRLAIFVLEQKEAKALDIARIAGTKRDGFNLRSFVDKHQLKPLGATLFRTQWDANMAGVMQRAGLSDQIDIEFKRKRVEPLPYKRRTERMR